MTELVGFGNPLYVIDDQYYYLQLGEKFHLPIFKGTQLQKPEQMSLNGEHGDSIINQTKENGHSQVRHRNRKKMSLSAES